MPNDLNERTWQELCTSFRGEALERKVVMLHTWNWIPAPDGRYVHDNRAIPFLRAGLRVPDADELDSTVGRDALDALALAHGDAGGRLAGGFLITDFGLRDWLRYGGVLKRGQDRGKDALKRMQAAEAAGDPSGYAAAAAWGAAARREMEGEVAARLSSPRRDLVMRFLAELAVHDHQAEPSPDERRTAPAGAPREHHHPH